MDVKITLEPITEHEGKIWDEKKNSWKRASSFHSLGHARSHLKKKISAWDENETYAALRHIPDSPPAFQLLDLKKQKTSRSQKVGDEGIGKFKQTNMRL